jgi:hypothetical protein
MVAEEFVEEKTRSPKVDLPVRSSIRMNDAFANGDETLGPSSMNSIMAANVPVVRGASFSATPDHTLFQICISTSVRSLALPPC